MQTKKIGHEVLMIITGLKQNPNAVVLNENDLYFCAHILSEIFNQSSYGLESDYTQNTDC